MDAIEVYKIVIAIISLYNRKCYVYIFPVFYKINMTTKEIYASHSPLDNITISLFSIFHQKYFCVQTLTKRTNKYFFILFFFYKISWFRAKWSLAASNFQATAQVNDSAGCRSYDMSLFTTLKNTIIIYLL